jgi:two-component system response regulator AtoC
VVARELHARSVRASKPFLKLNCAALSSELIDSKSFGDEPGAFIEAFQKKLEIFEFAQGGTLMLDEIGDMDLQLQAKLLQVLEDGEFYRTPGEPVRVDVRVVAATHKNLEKAIVEHRFREDLYYRLNGVNIRIPALRERREDILPLFDFLLRKRAAEDSPIPEITPALETAMLHHEWPGNVRELENFARRFLIFGDAEVMTRELSTRARRKAAAATPTLAVMPASGFTASLGLRKRRNS